MSLFELIEYTIRVTIVFGVGCILATVFRREAALRRWIWVICFASVFVFLLPIQEIKVPVLQPLEYQPSAESAVYELLPSFQQAEFKYLGDPAVSPVVIGFFSAGLVGLAVLAFRYLATLRLVRAAEQCTDEHLLDVVYEVSHQLELDDAPLLKRSDAITSPCVWGISQPVILIPAEMELDESQLRVAIEHELLHLKQLDPVRLVAYAMIRYAFWWNPLIGFGFRDANLAQEQIIDEKLRDVPGYAKLLVAKVSTRPQPALSRMQGQSHLLTRIRSMAEAPSVRGRWSNLALLAFVPTLLPIQPVSRYEPNSDQIGYDEVLYHADLHGERRFARMSSDGRRSKDLLDQFVAIGVPRLSPDGRWLGYTRVVDGQEDIFIARVDGTEERCIVASPKRDTQPLFSPDGTKIIFCTQATGVWEVGLYDLETGQWKLVTNDGKKNLEPTWHPNGERIVFSSHRAGLQKLFSMNLDGSDLIQLTFGPGEDTHGVYTSDGQRMIFATNRRSKYEAAILDLTTKVARPLVPLTQLDTGEVTFGHGERYVFMSAHDGAQQHVGRVDLRDMSFRIVSDGTVSAWPVTR